MTLSSRRVPPLRGILVLTAAALIPALAGCEAGAGAPTQTWHQPTAGATASVNGTIHLNNVFVLGPAPEATLAPGSSAGVFLAIYNGAAGGDRLVQVTAPGSADSVRLPPGGVPVGGRRSALLTGPAPEIVLDGLTHPLRGGQSVRMVLDFQRAGRVALMVPVLPRASYFSTFSPAPSPAAPSPAAPSSRVSPAPSG